MTDDPTALRKYMDSILRDGLLQVPMPVGRTLVVDKRVPNIVTVYWSDQEHIKLCRVTEFAWELYWEMLSRTGLQPSKSYIWDSNHMDQLFNIPVQILTEEEND